MRKSRSNKALWVLSFALLLSGTIFVRTAHSAGKSASASAPEVCTGASGPHVLFLMFLNAPPRVNGPDWVLQTTGSMEFDTCDACAGAAQSVANSIVRTPTINLVGWCFPKDLNNASNFLRSEKTGPGNIPLTPPLNLRPQR